jgi:hypothetical protein
VTTRAPAATLPSAAMRRADARFVGKTHPHRFDGCNLMRMPVVPIKKREYHPGLFKWSCKSCYLIFLVQRYLQRNLYGDQHDIFIQSESTIRILK